MQGVEKPADQLRKGQGKERRMESCKIQIALNADLGGTILSKSSRLPCCSGQVQNCSLDDSLSHNRPTRLPNRVPCSLPGSLSHPCPGTSGFSPGPSPGAAHKQRPCKGQMRNREGTGMNVAQG